MFPAWLCNCCRCRSSGSIDTAEPPLGGGPSSANEAIATAAYSHLPVVIGLQLKLDEDSDLPQ